MNIDRVFEALASTPRRKILAYLSEATLTAGEIAERFDISKPALSKHLKLLEAAGLVLSQKKGQYVHYRVAEDNLLAKLHSLLATFCPIGGPLQRDSKAIAQAKPKASKPKVLQPKALQPKASKPKSPQPKTLKPKLPKPEANSEQALPPSGNKLQLELAIGTPDLPPAAH